MSLRNTTSHYGSVSKFFHWVIAVWILLMLAIGISFNYLPKGNLMGFLMLIHKSSGVTLLVLMLLRLLWRSANPRPILPKKMPQWEIFATRWTHGLFYVVVFVMTLSGIVMSYAAGYPVNFWGLGVIPLPFIMKSKALSMLMAECHEYAAWTLGALIAFHVAGALKHYYVDKDDVLQRMWIGTVRKSKRPNAGKKSG